MYRIVLPPARPPLTHTANACPGTHPPPEREHGLLYRTLALEWGAHGIRVNGIAPGPIADTPGMAKLSAGLMRGAKDKVGSVCVPACRTCPAAVVSTVCPQPDNLPVVTSLCV